MLSCETCSAAGVDRCDSCPWGLALRDGKCTFPCCELDPSDYRDTAADRFVNVTTTLGFATAHGQSVQPLLDDNTFQDVVTNVLTTALVQAVDTTDRVDTGLSDTTPVHREGRYRCFELIWTSLSKLTRHSMKTFRQSSMVPPLALKGKANCLPS